ncbi:heart- and neural crest derivatives-expressed protein 2-like [Ctenocephalides felis]|uniref:heart- and neural crest derivatives-expressed protein 2-like n=1 Tax=Ctenocephalides felis TaxID=7515 RepID=UPI000E6E42C1|nr:heart- and neural crest derivatives-expressed protein 2-like [Ctenocephalides felis]
MSSFGSSDGDICQKRITDQQDSFEQNCYPLYQTLVSSTSYEMLPTEEGYWGSPCSSGGCHSVRGGSPHDNFERCPPDAAYPTALYAHQYQYEKGMSQSYYDEGYCGGQPGLTGTRAETVTTPGGTVRVIRRRNTANKKERRRTQSINTAFSDLRECIPNVPADTKLSKIKTLRLATSYISYLMGVLETDREPAGGFRAELIAAASGGGRRGAAANNGAISNRNANSDCGDSRRSKGRTGWPQHVWALELKQEQTL